MLKTKKNRYIPITVGITFIAAMFIMFHYVPPRMPATTATPIQQTHSTQPSSTKDQSAPSLIQQPFDQGEVTDDRWSLYLAYALYAYESLPAQFHIQQTQPTQPSSTKDQSTPALIDQAFNKGEITDEQRLLYLAYAIYESESLPAQFHSNVGWCGTFIIEELHEAANIKRICSMSPSIRSEFQRLLKSNITCD